MRSIFLACIMLLIVEGTKEVSAFPADANLGVERSANTADSLIPVKKGKGHGNRDERFERHHRHGGHGFSRHGGHSRGFHGFGSGNQNQPNGQN